MKPSYILPYVFFSLLLFALIMKWGYFLIQNKPIENFDVTNYQLYKEGDPNTPFTSHSVDLPINTTYQCTNICGPQSQCSITREQCTSDVDCYGCQPLFLKNQKPVENVRGQNDAGRLIYNQNPQYSVLTTDIGTRASLYGKKLGPVPKSYLGVDNWMQSASVGNELFEKQMTLKYSPEPEEYKFLPSYPIRETATGMFMDDGPLAANAYL